MAFSSSVAVTLLTGGEHGRGADIMSCIEKHQEGHKQLNQCLSLQSYEEQMTNLDRVPEVIT